MHIFNSTYYLSIQNCPQNSDGVQFRFQSPEWCMIKILKDSKLYSIEFLRMETTSDPSVYHREYSPNSSYSPVQFERSDDISIIKNSIKYSFVFFKCFIDIIIQVHHMEKSL